MAEYNGPDRRTVPEFYQVVCSPRLTRIEQMQDEMSRDVRDVREKVFNGLSDLPEQMKWLRRLLIGLLVSVTLMFGGLFLQNALATIKLQQHMKHTQEAVVEEVEDAVSANGLSK